MRAVWVTGATAIVLFAGIALYLSPLQPGVLELQFAFTPRAFALVVHSWSAEHLQRYRQHLPIDFILLACYGAFGYLLVKRAAIFHRQPPTARRIAALAMPFAAVFDAGENVLHWWLTATPRFDAAPVYLLSATCSTLKWILILGFGLIVAAMVARNRD